MTATSPQPSDGGGVELGQIESYLSNLWRQMADSRQGSPPLARVRVLNLIVYGEEPEVMQRAERLAQTLPARHPGRIVAVHLDRRRGGNEIEAGVATHCVREAGGRREVCGELITLDAPGATRRFVPNAAAGLLLSDLPVALWWTGAPNPDDDVFGVLTKELADTVLVDSAAGGHDAGTVMAVARWSATAHRHAVLGDLAWARLLPWREVVAEFFDQPPTRPLVHELREVQLAVAADLVCTDALLLAGWLASRLRWRLREASQDSQGVQAWYRSATGDVRIELHRTQTVPVGRIVAMRIAAGRTSHDFIYEAHRGTDVNVVHSHVTAADGARTVRGSGRAERGDEALVADLLDARARDAVYEAALARAAELAQAVEP